MAKHIELLGYRRFFAGESSGYNSYVENISSKKLIQITSIFNNQHLFQNHSNSIVQREIMRKLLVSVNFPEKDRLQYLFDQYFPDEKSNTLLFNVIANLKIIEKELSNYRIVDDTNLDANDLIIAYFKSYLTINDEIDQEQTVVFEPLQNDNKNEKIIDEGLKYLLPAHLPYHEIMYKNDLVYQLHLAINFFTFVDNRNDLKDVLVSTLTKHGQSSWMDYLKEIYKLLGNYQQIQENDNILRFDQIPVFISKNCHTIDQNAKIEQGRHGDFTFLRKHPIIQFGQNEFIISYLQLLLDKVFQGVRFDFVRAMAALPQYGSFGNAANEISQTFTHPFFETVIKSCFGNNPNISLLFDNQLNHITDGYIRDEQIVFLLEFKDEIIPITAKCSSKFDDIKSGIFEKFVFNKKDNRKKAVHQLTDAVLNLAFNLKIFDAKLNEHAKITYIPVIVYTDITLDFPGINKLLNDEFKLKRKEIYKQLNSSGRGNVREIKDLVLINFRLFVEYQNRFEQGEISLKELVLKNYSVQAEKLKQSLKGVYSTEEILQYFTSTDQIICNYIKEKLGKYIMPVQIKEEIKQLFPVNNEDLLNQVAE